MKKGTVLAGVSRRQMNFRCRWNKKIKKLCKKVKAPAPKLQSPKRRCNC